MNGKMINEYGTTTMQPSELNIVVQPVVQGTDPNNAQFEKANLGAVIDQQTDDRFNEDEAIVAALDERVTTIETAVASGYKYKGDCTYAQLPSSGQELGDMWYVTDRNDGYVWNGTTWRPMNDIGAAWVLCDDGNYRIGIRSRS